MKHDYINKFDMELLDGKIVMAFTDPLDTLMENYDTSMENNNYKYFTDDFTIVPAESCQPLGRADE